MLIAAHSQKSNPLLIPYKISPEIFLNKNKIPYHSRSQEDATQL